ncbi:glycerophosphodiester phosphodiesterase GDPDL6 [Eucalyptus grandis]|uniref:glycerophosphodiester phosphodiesterase GDPDL6 n=1 Tax=Eucalyptus grandis TaxID=71139 RepID=UPI00192EC176|nr:glycerophosphodiester phosphodiesterase GDPDL6 [Eucalyptus grandis]
MACSLCGDDLKILSVVTASMCALPAGDKPVVIARGGFSGIFPDSSEFAVDMATTSSMGDVVLYCDLQLTKDGIGICQPDIKLDNTTDIAMVFPKGEKTYTVNGQDLKGWFAVDYTSDELFNNVTLVQNVLSRPSLFDGAMSVQAVDDIVGRKTVNLLWLNVQYDGFYNEHKHSPATYVQKVVRYYPVDYLSSPEIGFLKAMKGKVNKARTKLIFRFLAEDAVEPSTNQTYGSILKNLESIKAFASGILVPKEYIYPVGTDKYLGAPTSLVADAHKQGLEVYASGFANDNPASFNYSYDPTSEYLQFIDNSEFSVDGLLTDFPPTASETIGFVNALVLRAINLIEMSSETQSCPFLAVCFTQNNNSSKPIKGKALIISHNGASGNYPGCTDLAYQQAIDDGSDIIDCSVQMSKDGVAFCLDSADLSGDTTAMPTFMSQSTVIPEIQQNSGIFSFDLTWSEIQSLKPQLVSPFGSDAGFQRDPANKNKGKFVTLSEFLELAKSKAVSGVLINIENAAYLASKKGLGIVDTVSKALSNATFDKQSTQQVLIQSDDSSVLSQFKNVSTYKRVLTIEEKISDAPKQPVEEIKKYADAVTVTRPTIMPISESFLLSNTSVIDEMHAANISVYVSVLRNEYISLAFDYFADPILELATYVAGFGVDGIITEYPATANKYMRSPCFDLNAKEAILPVQPGSLIGIIQGAEPPAEAPAPVLEVSDIVDPPLPPVVANVSSNSPPAPAPDAKHSSALKEVANLGLSLAVIVALGLLF